MTKRRGALPLEGPAQKGPVRVGPVVVGLLATGLVLLSAGCGRPPSTPAGAADSPARAAARPAGAAGNTAAGQDVAVGAAAAGCRGAARHFSLSLVTDRGGAGTATEAAKLFIKRNSVPGFGGPPGAWAVTGRDRTGVTLRSGPVQLHAVQGPDRTWQIDSGQRCT